jgi:hypothetical protein
VSALTKAELDTINSEVEQLNSEMDWRDPNIEWCWFEWADDRLTYLLEVLESIPSTSPIRESGLRLVRGAS